MRKKGYKQTDETKAKISMASKRYMSTPETRVKISIAMN